MARTQHADWQAVTGDLTAEWEDLLIDEEVGGQQEASRTWTTVGIY